MGIFIDLPWWAYVAVALGLTHVTIAAVTIFLHRNQAHRSVDLAPSVSHFFRLWLWLTTGMITKEWTAVHRKHHAKVESEDDPHSPQVYGIMKVVFWGAGLYTDECKNKETIEKYGYGTPDDWVERNVYSRHTVVGILIMLTFDIVMFGPIAGIPIWVVQMFWIPFWAAGVINGVGHYFGYRNFQTGDESRNIVPVAVLIGGEELHNNHHAHPTSSKLSSRWWEFDMGWGYIRLLESMGLAKVKRIAPKLHRNDKLSCDLDTLHSIIANRFEVLSEFAVSMRRTCAKEAAEFRRKHGGETVQGSVFKKWLSFRTNSLSESERESLKTLVENSVVMRKIEHMNEELASLWEDREASVEQLVERLRQWCRKAEDSGIDALRRFATELRGFSSVPSAAV